MQITDIKTFLVQGPPSPDGWTTGKSFLFVKIETDEGIVGWGEAFVLTDQEQSIAQLIAEIGRYLIGRDPLNVRRFAAQAFHRFAERRAGLAFYCAQSGLEIALWDIAGKARGLPVHALLGGPCREQVRLYANFWSPLSHPTEAIVEQALALKDQGFTALKIYPLQCPTLREAEDRVRRVREAIGPDLDLMIDLSGPIDPPYALEAARRFIPYDPFWIEEPVASHDLGALARLNQQIPARVVTGERLCGLYAFRDVLERQAADCLNPDIVNCGGILTFLEIAAMAEAFTVTVSPHNYNSMAIAMAAMLQVSALASNAIVAEYFPYFQPLSDAVATSRFEIQGGTVTLPQGPGLGLELDEAALLAHAFDNRPLRSLDL